MPRYKQDWLLTLLVALALLAGVLALGSSLVAWRQSRTHNSLGGYIEACGDKPGVVGDDC